MPRGSAFRPLVLMLLIAGAAPAARAACGGTQLCDPGVGECLVSAACTIAAADFQLNDRPLRVTAALTLTGGATAIIRAGDVTVANGGKIFAAGVGGSAVPGGDLVITSSGKVEVQTGGTLDTHGPEEGGSLDVIAAGDVLIRGRILANATAGDGFGGAVSLESTAGAVEVAGLGISASAGGANGGGGLVSLSADIGDVRILAPIDASKGACDFCSVDVTAGGNVTSSSAGTIALNSTYTGGADGGELDVTATGSVTLNGKISAGGSAGGYGGVVDLESLTDGAIGVAIAAQPGIDLPGSAGGGGGMFCIDTEGPVSVNAKVVLEGNGVDSPGGEALISGDSVTLANVISANGQGSGGDIEVDGTGAITVNGTLQAEGPPGAPNGVTITGCGVTLAAGATISAGTTGSNLIQASGAMLIGGFMKASSAAGGGNLLQYREVPPLFQATANVSPPPAIEQNPLLVCCGTSCPTTTTSTTTSTTVATTSSTATTQPPTTTTTLAPPSTTTTSLPDSTTTTTTIAGTTTTTSTVAGTTTTSSSSTSSSSSSTSTSSEPPTSTTSTSSTSLPTSTVATTSTVEPTTTSTEVSATTTTTQTEAQTCDEQPLDGFVAVGCRLGLMQDVVRTEDPLRLGGKRVARRLGSQLQRIERAVDNAAAGKRVVPSIRRATRALRAFDRGVTAATRHGMPPEIAARLHALSGSASSELGVIASIR